jgi:hypothetical protein
MGFSLNYSGRKTKINELDDPVLANHHVVSLNVAMGNAALVQIADCL